MKNLKLFEEFSQLSNLEMMVSKLSSVPKYRGWNFTLDTSDKDIPFLIWSNPADSAKWRNSGYAEGFDNMSNVSPMPVLAFGEIFGELFAYALTPEEKYGQIVALGGDIGSQIKLIGDLADLEDAIDYSLWEIEG